MTNQYRDFTRDPRIVAQADASVAAASSPRKIILDCDPGHDDAIALLLAHGSPMIELLAVTTVGGNQTLEKVTRNAASLAKVYGIEGVPFAAGCSRPLVREPENAPSIHGETGLDGVVLPEPIELDSRHGVDLIIDTIMGHDAGEVTLVPTGPLTNIAMAARKEPRIVERVREVVLMGGSAGTGNWSAAAEFNIWADPEAAHVVFNEKWPVVMVGLDLTHQAVVNDAVLDKIAAIGSQTSQFVLDLFTFFKQSHQGTFGMDEPPVHDPCAVAYCIDPRIVKTVQAPVQIELHGSMTAGRTVVDFREPAPESCHTKVALELDFDAFWDLVVGAIRDIS
ncbi:purine nucleosidase [Arcanobacterium pluranimalium]|uniref:uridine-preferring nucleoside hydrolase UriH n=1 Tax=Arcanobacterium pluranimalium TaxID=108028 RepID=UPI0019560A46|nr:nucleoside hydrolase [Arcanobacterium pluranimalium]MBM7824502.1 purine nucleosidase [Arcanobacterium pluranimalium]